MKKTVMISGASRGIGGATALCFAEAGWNLALCCRENGAALEELSEEIREKYGADVLSYVGDIGCFDRAKEFCSEALKRFGHIDVLVNNAGMSYVGLMTDMEPEDWRRLMSSNLDSVWNCCRLVCPSMINRKEGRIINVSSVWGVKGASCETAYSASKGAVNAFTQALGRELAPSGVAVNAVAFGFVDTDMNSGFSAEDREAIAEEIPAGRFASPSEAAEFIYSLACSNSYLTAQVIQYDGGWI